MFLTWTFVRENNNENGNRHRSGAVVYQHCVDHYLLFLGQQAGCCPLLGQRGCCIWFFVTQRVLFFFSVYTGVFSSPLISFFYLDVTLAVLRCPYTRTHRERERERVREWVSEREREERERERERESERERERERDRERGGWGWGEREALSSKKMTIWIKKGHVIWWCDIWCNMTCERPARMKMTVSQIQLPFRV